MLAWQMASALMRLAMAAGRFRVAVENRTISPVTVGRYVGDRVGSEVAGECVGGRVGICGAFDGAMVGVAEVIAVPFAHRQIKFLGRLHPPASADSQFTS